MTSLQNVQVNPNLLLRIINDIIGCDSRCATCVGGGNVGCMTCSSLMVNPPNLEGVCSCLSGVNPGYYFSIFNATCQSNFFSEYNDLGF